MWKVKFRSDFHDKAVELYADVVEIDHLFATLSGIRTKLHSSSIVIAGSEDFEEFVEFDPLIIPSHNIVFAGQIKDVSIRPLEVAKK